MGDQGDVVDCLGLMRVCEGALLIVSSKRPSPHQRHSSSSPRWSTQARHAHTPANTVNQNAHQIKASRIKAKRTQIRASESQEQKMLIANIHSKSDEHISQTIQRLPDREETTLVGNCEVWLVGKWEVEVGSMTACLVRRTFGPRRGVAGSNSCKRLVS